MFNDSDSLLLGRHKIHSSPLPGSGAVLAYILNILKHFDFSPEDDTPLLYHRITEAFKWAYAERTKLGDPSDPAITEEMKKVLVTTHVSYFPSETTCSTTKRKVTFFHVP